MIDDRFLEQRPANPNRIKQRIIEISKRPTPTEYENSKWFPIHRQLVEACGESDLWRKTVLAWFFLPPQEFYKPGSNRQMSSTELTPQQKNALRLWVGMHKTEDDEWQPHPAFREEAMAVINMAIQDHVLVGEAEKLGGEVKDVTVDEDSLAEKVKRFF